MKVLVISDSHGNIANVNHAMGFGKKVNVGAVVHCGDWNNLTTVSSVLSFGIPLYTVLGNADIDPNFSSTLAGKSRKFNPLFLEFEIDGKKIGVVHKPKDIKVGEHDIIFHGHTHKQMESIKDGTRIVNPGALEKTINFAVYDTANGEISFFNE